MVESFAQNTEVPLTEICEILEVSRSAYYAWLGASPSLREEKDTLLIPIVRKMFYRHKRRYGARRIASELGDLGHPCGVRRALRFLTAVYTVVALTRFGGLRCSSEVALLKWSDIHWDKERFTVTSPKTKRYGKGSRVVPLFLELRPFLDEAFSMASEGETWVIPMLDGKPTKNLGTTFKKIVRRAGVNVWPKPFQNLRSSRQTELEQQFPTYVVCAWLGNTPSIAHKHYLTVTDEHFDTAAKTGDSLGMQPPVSRRTDSQKKTRTVHLVRENASFAEVVGILENARVAEEGLEPPTRGL